MYILVTVANRKDAKRHVVTRSHDINYLRDLACNMDIEYRCFIYTGNWKLVEEV